MWLALRLDQNMIESEGDKATWLELGSGPSSHVKLPHSYNTTDDDFSRLDVSL